MVFAPRAQRGLSAHGFSVRLSRWSTEFGGCFHRFAGVKTETNGGDWWAGPDLNRRPQPRKGCFRLAL